jgi:citrate synthase
VTTYVSATEAARMLGVTKPTLYAYVSRGIVGRSTAADGRTSLYAREEIQQLAGRARRRESAPATIDVQISSTITELQDEQLSYRGHDAAGLARDHSFERVAELLWAGALGQRGLLWPVEGAGRSRLVGAMSERARDSQGRRRDRAFDAGRDHPCRGLARR